MRVRVHYTSVYVNFMFKYLPIISFFICHMSYIQLVRNFFQDNKISQQVEQTLSKGNIRNPIIGTVEYDE